MNLGLGSITGRRTAAYIFFTFLQKLSYVFYGVSFFCAGDLKIPGSIRDLLFIASILLFFLITFTEIKLENIQLESIKFGILRQRKLTKYSSRWTYKSISNVLFLGFSTIVGVAVAQYIETGFNIIYMSVALCACLFLLISAATYLYASKRSQ
ncbi:hypothetical protein C1752_00877 [Acaryochloris thomasi RCC1774]|uniref:Uncharacterized protein n=1 Tax=Acaryochloris thomasi RCC1774 TaxID=1764569 RepID=A0A2W1JNE0_9CYAN|nr:hypothetical protein [Acaryochloris thomasi]PZD74843.1 hypothetical protein C1752_00877 [Acaryochloris thomasi RCC1774]